MKVNLRMNLAHFLYKPFEEEVIKNVKKKNIISRVLNSINYLIWGDV